MGVRPGSLDRASVFRRASSNSPEGRVRARFRCGNPLRVPRCESSAVKAVLRVALSPSPESAVSTSVSNGMDATRSVRSW